MKKIFLILFTAAIAISCGCDKEGALASDVIIPIPNKVVAGDASISLKRGLNIKSNSCQSTTEYLMQELLKDGLTLSTSGKRVEITVDSDSGIEPQGYKLAVTKRGVEIVAADQAGAFYGAQTLLQLITEVEGEKVLLCQSIEDAPRFEWRSYMMDEARHFFGEEHAYRTLDIMASLKLNVLHWHLTDDAGWRIEIPQYPLLTEVGSKRKDTEITWWGSGKTAGVPHEGFYTQEQIRKIVAYAKQRQIKIIPEIEMPGHASASIAAYPWLGTEGKQIEVPITFGKHYNIYNVIDPRVEEFFKNVIVEVIDLFDTDVVHIGGDEVRFNQWEKDAEMIAHKKKMGYSSFMDIQIEFTNKMSHFIEEHGCSMMGWNEILGTNLHHDDNISFSDASTNVAKNVVVHFWKGDIKAMTQAAKDGYRLVNSYHASTYLDYSYKTIPLTKAYAFEPIPADLEEQYHSNIVGLGCQMWSEWTPTIADVERQTYPRIAAYAEVGWSNNEVKSYDSFVARLNPIMQEWIDMGINVTPIDKANIIDKK